MSDIRATIFYHADCLDGFGAAWCAWRHFGHAADYLAMHYGDPWPEDLVAGRAVFILDFSAEPAVIRDLARRAERLLLLDHHATPSKAWSTLLCPDPERRLKRHDDAELGLTVAFDMDRSGARLAWDWFFPDQPLPQALAHIEDQDLWRFHLADTRAYCRALRRRAFDFVEWDRVISESGSATEAAQAGYGQMLLEGAAIEDFFRREVTQLAAAPALSFRLGGVTGLGVNANALFASELGDALAQRSGTFGLTWYLRGDGRVKLSLRASGGVDVAELAEAYGGGGHPNAAGITLALADFLDLLPPPVS